MHRFHLPPEQCQGGELELAGPEAHHARTVLRLQQGDAVTILDGAGTVIDGTVLESGKRFLRVRVLRRVSHPRPACTRTLCQAIPKGKTIESIVQRATELGVQRLVPLVTARVISRPDADRAEGKAGQWQQVAVEAAKQCGTPWIPQVDPPTSLARALARESPAELGLVAALAGSPRHPRAWFRAFRERHQRFPRSIAVWIGPEGDFAPDELDAICNHGALPITLGPLVLRVETAALACLAQVNYELQAAEAGEAWGPASSTPGPAPA